VCRRTFKGDRGLKQHKQRTACGSSQAGGINTFAAVSGQARPIKRPPASANGSVSPFDPDSGLERDKKMRANGYTTANAGVKVYSSSAVLSPVATARPVKGRVVIGLQQIASGSSGIRS
jgi:hypothetical protein